MATLEVQGQYYSAGAGGYRSLTVVLTYTVSSTNPQTTLTLNTVALKTIPADLHSVVPYVIKVDNVTLASGRVGEGSLGQTKTWNRTTSSQTAQLEMIIQEDYFGSATITIPPLPTYSISYNANGGSGAPNTQTKYYGINIALSTIIPSRTNYVFKDWNTAANGSGITYQPGATYTGNSALTLYAQWNTYNTVSYNANGGTGAPDSQIKVYNQTLVLTTTKPTRDGFTFSEWNTASDGTGTTYLPGGSYSTNADMVLYAIWKAAPIINSLTAIRCDSQGVEDNEGEYALVTCEWYLNGSSGESGTLSGTVVAQNDDNPTAFTFSSGGSGYGTITATAIVGQGNGIQLDTNMQYTISVTATNGNVTASQNVILTRSFFTMDWRAGGRGIGIGRAAPDNGLEVGYETTIDNELHVLEDIDTPKDIHCNHIYTNGWTWNELYDTFTWNRLLGGLTPPSS